MRMRKRIKNVAFLAETVLLISIIVLCFGGSARGQSRETEADYRVMEAELLKETRQYLNRSGYLDSGVTLTRVIDEEGRREYTFTIHHSKIDRMDESGRENLKHELAEFCRAACGEFPSETCTFRHNFLVVN